MIILHLLAVAPPPAAEKASDHLGLSPTGCAVLIVIAFLLDFLTILPAWLQVRLTFASVVTAVRAGFDDSPLDKWTVDKASGAIQMALDQAKGAYIAGASAAVLTGCLVGVLAIYCIGCMLPVKWSKKAGRLATLQWKETPIRNVSPQLWVAAILLGLLADLPPDGWMATCIDAFVGACRVVAAPLPHLIFGAS